MRFLFLYVFITVAFSSCRILPPTFKTINNTRFERVGSIGIKLGADAVFHNPNFVRCKVSDIAVDVIIDKQLVGVLGEKKDIVIKPKSDFSVPLGISIKPDGTLLDNIKNFLGVITNKEADLFFVGSVKVKVLCMTHTIPVKFQQHINLGALKK